MIGNCPKGTIKKSPSAGVTKFSSGANSLAIFIPKWKTNPTLRNLFGDATWADPFSYSALVTQYVGYDSDGSQAVSQWSYAEGYSGLVQIFVIESVGGEYTDPTTGAYAPPGICFVDVATFGYDLGNIPLADGCFVVQTDASPEISLANNNRAILAKGY